jgi:hypothetical protein
MTSQCLQKLSIKGKLKWRGVQRASSRFSLTTAVQPAGAGLCRWTNAGRGCWLGGPYAISQSMAFAPELGPMPSATRRRRCSSCPAYPMWPSWRAFRMCRVHPVRSIHEGLRPKVYFLFYSKRFLASADWPPKLAAIQSALGEASFAVTCAEGQALAVEQTNACAPG